MLELSDKKRILILVAICLSGICIILSTFNIHFEVSNNKLETDIDQFSEEKENLRAKYLSEISLNKLDSRALAMKMQQASSLGRYKISTKRSALKRNKLKKAVQVKEKHILISGY